MLTKWYLHKFKSFTDETTLDLKPLTVLTGPNSAGKSSVIQSMLLLTQTFIEKYTKNSLLLNGPLIACGSAEDVISKKQSEKSFSIGCNISFPDIASEYNGAVDQDETTDIGYADLESDDAANAIPVQTQFRVEVTSVDFLDKENNKAHFMPLIESFSLKTDVNQSGEQRLVEWDITSNTDNAMQLKKRMINKKKSTGEIPQLFEGLRYLVRQGGTPIEYFILTGNKDLPIRTEFTGLSFSGLLPDKYHVEFDKINQQIDMIFDLLGIPGGKGLVLNKVDLSDEFTMSEMALYRDFLKLYEKDEEVSGHPFKSKWLGFRPFCAEETKGQASKAEEEDYRIFLYRVFSNTVLDSDIMSNFRGAFKEVLIEMLKQISNKLPDCKLIDDCIEQIRQDGSMQNILKAFNSFYEQEACAGVPDTNKNFHTQSCFVKEFEIAKSIFSKKLRTALSKGVKSRRAPRSIKIASNSLWRKFGTDVVDYFLHHFQYVGPLRDDPKPLYPIGKSGSEKDVGAKGEQTAHVLYLFGKEKIDYVSAREFEDAEEKPIIEKTPLIDAVNDWLMYMGVADKIDPGIPGKLGYALKIKPSAQEFYLDLTQVGVGASQVLPILTAGLVAEPGTTLVFEQPELHLHPRVQSRLADFFVSLMLCGKQVIVETHSEYIINRLRYRSAVASSDLVASQVGILFFENDKGTTKVKNVQMNEYGYIGEWPKGFFDEGDDLAVAILKAGSMKRNLSSRLAAKNE